MARRAVWRALPDDPRTPLGWLFADEGSRGLPPVAVGGLALAVAMLALAWSPWLLATLPLLALQTRRPRSPRDLAPYRTEPPPGPAFDCRIEVLMCDKGKELSNGALLGTDDGVLTLVDGWLHYAGGQTEFALRRPDVWIVTPDEKGALLGLGERRLLRIATGDPETLRRALRVWEATTEPPEGESLLLPAGIHPVALARAWRDVLGTVALWLAASGVLFALFHEIPWIVFCTGSGSLAAFGHLREVRRLAREEWMP